MSHKAIYACPCVETGGGVAVDPFARLGLDTAIVAGAYRAGKILRPHGRRSGLYFSADGTVHFMPRTEP